MSTAIERVAQYNREYRARVKAEKKKVVHVATYEEMEAMKAKWLKTHAVIKLSDEGYRYSLPGTMVIKGSMGGSLV